MGVFFVTCRKGRRRGGKLSAMPTDLSGVLDFLVPDTWERSKGSVQQAHSPKLQADIFTLADTPGGCAFRPCRLAKSHCASAALDWGKCGCHVCWMQCACLESQPHLDIWDDVIAPLAKSRVQQSPAAAAGCYVIPGALSGEQQRQLAVAALQEYPEPPSRSNHSRAHGPLPRLWEAAQLDLRLAHAGNSACCCCPEQPPCAQQLPGDQACSPGIPRPEGNPERCDHSCGGRELHRCDSQFWSLEGPGPSARHLLSTLRWVTLGPQYGWTARTYDRESPHTPLPSRLVQLAQRFAAAAAELDAVSAACAGDEGQCSSDGGEKQSPVRSSMRLSEQCQGRSDSQRTAGSEGCSGSLDAGSHSQSATEGAPEQHTACIAQHHKSTQGKAGCGLTTPFSSRQRKAWEPDVALVNYYREGDTLGGHQDDVERDKEAPIVAISLGCDAIFLLGGESAACAPRSLPLPSFKLLCLGFSVW